jgi:hypothetical protein
MLGKFIAGRDQNRLLRSICIPYAGFQELTFDHGNKYNRGGNLLLSIEFNGTAALLTKGEVSTSRAMTAMESETVAAIGARTSGASADNF